MKPSTPVKDATQRSRWVSILLGSAVFAVLLGAAIEVLYLMPAKSKQDYFREIRVQMAPQLRTLNNLAQVGRQLQKQTWIFPPPPPHVWEALERDADLVLVPPLGARMPVKGDTTTDTLTLVFPAFVSDSEIRKQWTTLLAEVEGELGSLDTEAFREYQNLKLFLRSHPLPASDTMEASMMEWSEAEVRVAWRDINDRICCVADRLLQLAQLSEDRSLRGLVQFALADRRLRSTEPCETPTPPVA